MDIVTSLHASVFHPCTRAASWKVEGMDLEDTTKLQELTTWKVGILCLQEIHILGSDFFEYSNLLVVLPGAEGNARSYAGEGFMVAPNLKRAVACCKQFSDRLASLRLYENGGQLLFCIGILPHELPRLRKAASVLRRNG